MNTYFNNAQAWQSYSKGAYTTVSGNQIMCQRKNKGAFQFHPSFDKKIKVTGAHLDIKFDGTAEMVPYVTDNLSAQAYRMYSNNPTNKGYRTYYFTADGCDYISQIINEGKDIYTPIQWIGYYNYDYSINGYVSCDALYITYEETANASYFDGEEWKTVKEIKCYKDGAWAIVKEWKILEEL